MSDGHAQDVETIGYETEIEDRNGHSVPIEVTVAKTTWHDATADLLIVRDVTDRKRAQNVLQEAHDQLEQRVAERTRELETKRKKLEEVNTALKVLLQQREEDKQETEAGIYTQIKELAMPYLAKLKHSLLTSGQKAYVDILEANLTDIIDPLARSLSASLLNLTPAEIRVANLVKLGKTTKEMADLLNLSTRTIESHRDSIRHKLGIKNRRANLRSHLLSI
jgi:DNA-binding CsgD family transcriptional regulator